MARVKGLHHTTDDVPGITRKSVGENFVFLNARGKKIESVDAVKRIESIGIPPAYHDVWICPDRQGHLQATARDDKGRKQYFYHPLWNEHRDATKFDSLLTFADSLSTIRRRVANDLSLPGLEKDKIIATIIRLLDTTYVRIGNEEYARDNKSYGLTTMLNRHLKRFRKHTDIRQREIPLAAFDPSDVSAVKAGKLGELFL